MDHSKIPNEDDWERMLDELDDHVAQLRKHSKVARARAKEKVRDGYPTRSMPDGGSGGGSGDPTADHVIRTAGGTDDDKDTWRGAYDPIGQSVRRMIAETTDARNRLRGATANMARALPVTIPDVPREVCASCGVPKHIAKGWAKAEGRCEACSSRIKRVGKTGVA